MSNFTHLVLTRFNVRFNNQKPKTGLDSEWLIHRFKLFENYCYSSVYGQSNQNFKWIVFFDAKTPLQFRQKIEQYSQWVNFIPVYIDSYYNAAIGRQHALKHVDPESSHLITSRLDNDDSIAKNYVELVQNEFEQQESQFIIFSDGYVLKESKLYKFNYPNNPFINLIESRKKYKNNEFRTVLGLNHTELGHISDIKRINSKQVWLQVVHEKNISNRVRGIRHSIKPLLRDFSVRFEARNSVDKGLEFYIDKFSTLLMSPFERVVQKLPRQVRASLKRFISQLV